MEGDKLPVPSLLRAAPAHTNFPGWPTNTPGHGTWSWALLAQETSGRRGTKLGPDPAAVTTAE